jgi:hypothetical protein
MEKEEVEVLPESGFIALTEPRLEFVPERMRRQNNRFYYETTR